MFWLVPVSIILAPFATLAIGMFATPWPLRSWEEWDQVGATIDTLSSADMPEVSK